MEPGCLDVNNKKLSKDKKLQQSMRSASSMKRAGK